MNHGQISPIDALARGKNVIEDLALTEGRIVQSGIDECNDAATALKEGRYEDAMLYIQAAHIACVKASACVQFTARYSDALGTAPTERPVRSESPGHE